MDGDRVYLGVDVGSASVRAGVFDDAGRRLAFAVRPIQQFRPRANFVEQSTADIWAAVCAAIREAVTRAGVAADAVAAVGFDATCSLVAVGPGGASVSVAEDGAVERDIVMWMDHRAVEETAAINATRDPALAYVGGEVSIEMELPKLLWLRRRFPDRFAAAQRFFDLADYLVWRSCGADTASVCTLTCKWNYLAHEARFPDAMLRAVGLGDLGAKLPARVLPLGSSPGTLTAAAAAAFGLSREVIVATGIIDAHAGGLALVGTRPAGSLALIGGTSNCHMVVSPQPIMVPGVWGPYFGAMLPGYWLNEGGQSAAGALLDWTLRQGEAWPLAEEAAARDRRSVYAVLNDWVADLAAREPWPTRHLHVLPDHHGNRSPRANPQARGMLSGLTLEGGRDALARVYLATLQALAYGTRHIVDSLNAAGHRIEHLVMCGGGTKNPLLLQEHADALGQDLHLVEEEDAVTLGAALLAATASGRFADLPAAAAAMVRPGGRVAPRADTRPFHAAKYEVFLQLYDDQQRHQARMAHWQ
ncbi:MAG: FGGY-family carbohydrate kinase [Betaproteobacteria bacterium]|nr:FGGY-family carbohydrate kinase [Betaproteobacteria bacterium]MBK7589991.1 FGGY-family carbohydrate kinase [Betaproteobacteria bacterium]MBK7743604.1 FGGY-family carbohydrate kinase [Betaproteobacteria bacterium]MBK8687166.1 FGGY-family carbohydrate kinase [Betaproteobacteria bacterium]